MTTFELIRNILDELNKTTSPYDQEVVTLTFVGGLGWCYHPTVGPQSRFFGPFGEPSEACADAYDNGYVVRSIRRS